MRCEVDQWNAQLKFLPDSQVACLSLTLPISPQHTLGPLRALRNCAGLLPTTYSNRMALNNHSGSHYQTHFSPFLTNCWHARTTFVAHLSKPRSQTIPRVVAAENSATDNQKTNLIGQKTSIRAYQTLMAEIEKVAKAPEQRKKQMSSVRVRSMYSTYLRLLTGLTR